MYLIIVIDGYSWLLIVINWYHVVPPSYKVVYKPHEYYSYKYHKP